VSIIVIHVTYKHTLYAQKSTSMSPSRSRSTALTCIICIICIDVVSAVSQYMVYNYVYYCDTPETGVERVEQVEQGEQDTGERLTGMYVYVCVFVCV
jgi:prenyltransferase beta subunit